MTQLRNVVLSALLVAVCGGKAGGAEGSDVVAKIEGTRKSGAVRLDLSDSGIGELPSLEGLTKVEWLSLAGNQIADLAPLAGGTYEEHEQPAVYQSQASYALVPTRHLIDLQAADRESRMDAFARLHGYGLNSPELRAMVIGCIRESSYNLQMMLAPYVMEEPDSSPPDVAEVVSYSIAIDNGFYGKVFTISSRARDAESAELVTVLVRQEYDKLRQRQAGRRLERSREALETLIRNSGKEEMKIRNDLNQFLLSTKVSDLASARQMAEDYMGGCIQQISGVKIQKVKINSTMRQVLGIRARISKRGEAPPPPSSSPPEPTSSSSEEEFPVATPLSPPAPPIPIPALARLEAIKGYFEISAIQSFGDVPQLRKRFGELERRRRSFEMEHSEEAPEMLENARKIVEVEELLGLEVRAAIEDLRYKFHELDAMEMEFRKALEQAESELKELRHMETVIERHRRALQLAEASTDAYLRRLRELRIEEAMAAEDPLRLLGPASPGVRIKDSPESWRVGALSFGELKQLDLGNNKVTDLTPLKSLSKLERLNLAGNPIPQEQKEMLKQALPNCEITF